MQAKYEELGEEVDDVEKDWKKYKDEFVGIEEVLCGRSTVMTVLCIMKKPFSLFREIWQ